MSQPHGLPSVVDTNYPSHGVGAPAGKLGPHKTLTNDTTAALSSSGRLTVYNAAGTVNVDLDVQGYYAPNVKISDLQTQIATLQTKQTTDEASVTALTTLLSGVSRVTLDSQPTLRFSGTNLQIVNGAGTESALNGRGNLIVGYDDNTTTNSGINSSISGGYGNTASGLYSTVAGGYINEANGYIAAILGGELNKSPARCSSVPATPINGTCS